MAKRSILLLTVLAGLLSLPGAVSAQTTHSHPKPTVIDGRNTPELIPDSTAYRLFFIAVTPKDDTSEEFTKEDIHLAGIGLGFSDTVAVKNILDDFRKQYDNMVNEYNGGLRQHPGTQADYDSFSAQVEALVTKTLKKIEATVSEDGANQFHAHIQHEKKGMQLVTVQ